MTIKLKTFQDTVDNIISADENELDSIKRNDMVKAAVERYSHDLPDEVTGDITGDGGNYYDIATGLSSWSEGFSQILSIQYPAPDVTADEAPTYLEPEDWDDEYWSDDSGSLIRYLYLPNHAPAATETIRIKYTAPYTWTLNVVDVPPAHFYAICNLAASLTAQAIAQKYSRTNDSTISLDSVDHLSRAQQWAQRARELMEQYSQQLHLGDGTDGGQPAGEFVDWDTRPGGNRVYLYHRDR